MKSIILTVLAIAVLLIVLRSIAIDILKTFDED